MKLFASSKFLSLGCSSTWHQSYRKATRKGINSVNVKYYSADAQLVSQKIKDTFPAKLQRSEELLVKAQDHVAKEEYDLALPLLESSLDILKKFGGDEKGKMATYIYLNLAYTYQHMKRGDIEDLYKKAIDSLKSNFGPKHRDLGIAQLNYAEFLVSKQRTEEALEQVTSAIKVIREHHKNDSFIAAALNNQAGYLCVLNRYEEARAPCNEALKIFSRELGRQNEYTRSAFSNMYQILKKLGLADDITDLETDWHSVDKSDAKGLSEKELKDITEEFMHTVKLAEPKAQPNGLTKGPKLFRRELDEFFGDLEGRGIDIADPIFTPILKQEVSALRSGEKQREYLTQQLRLKREQIIKARQTPADEMDYLRKMDFIDSRRKSWKVWEDEQEISRAYTSPLRKPFDADGTETSDSMLRNMEVNEDQKMKQLYDDTAQLLEEEDLVREEKRLKEVAEAEAKRLEEERIAKEKAARDAANAGGKKKKK